MTIKKFYNLLSNGKIKVRDNNHAFDLGHFIDHMKWQIEYYEDMCKKHKNDESYKYYSMQLYREINQFDEVNIGFSREIKCYYCEATLGMIYLGNNEAIMIDSEIIRSCEKDGRKLSDYIYTLCPMTDIVNKGYLEANIHVKNGKLVFANYFDNERTYDFDKDKRYKKGTNICHINGRNNLMQHLANRNVGYGQTGNMTLAVFVSNDRKTILIASPYNDEDEENTIEGYELVGEICCDVWRWQCADTSVLEKYGTTIDENFIEDNIVIDVPKGEWNIKHYYDFMPEEDYYENNKPMTVLTLVE